GDIVAATQQHHTVGHAMVVEQCRQLAIPRFHTFAHQHTLDARMLLCNQSQGRKQGVMILERVPARDTADQESVSLNIPVATHFLAYLRVGAPGGQVVAIWNDQHAVRVVAHLAMASGGLLSTGDDDARYPARKPRTHPRDDPRAAAAVLQISPRIAYAPCHGLVACEPGGDAPNQICMVHPGLYHVRVQAAQQAQQLPRTLDRRSSRTLHVQRMNIDSRLAQPLTKNAFVAHRYHRMHSLLAGRGNQAMQNSLRPTLP